MSENSKNETAVQITDDEIRAFMLKIMWDSLDENEKDNSFAAFWTSQDQRTKSIRANLLKSLALELRFRSVFIERASLEKKIGYLKKVIQKKPFCFHHDSYIRAWLIETRAPLLNAFLNGASVPNENGITKEDSPPSAGQLSVGIATIREKFSVRDVAVYLAYLGFFGGSSGFWNQITKATGFEEIVMKLKHDRTPTADKSIDSEREEPDEPESCSDGFTTLDDLLIRTQVASAFHEEGSLSADEMEDLIEEVVELNAPRHRSLFHRGFFHALFDREFAFHFSAENSERRQWYLCGVLFGLLRKNQADRCVEIFAVSEKELGQEVALSSGSQCGPKLLPLLYLPLLQAGHIKLALSFADHQLPRLSNLGQRIRVIRGFMDYGAKLLRDGKTAESETIFDLLGKAVTGQKVELPAWFHSFANPWIKRRKAQCLQAKGSFAAAKAMLGEFDVEDSDVSPYKVLADLGLIEGSFRSLAAVLPKTSVEKNSSLIESLKLGVASFEKAVELGGDNATNAHFCLGLLRTLESPSQYAQERADRFQTAMGGMLDDEDAYSSNDILDWTRFLLALALLETAEPSNYVPASDLIPLVIETEFKFPGFLWERVFEAAAMFDDSTLAILIGDYLLSCREDATECLMDNAALIARSEPLFEAVLERFLIRKISVKKRWARLEQLLPIALQHAALDVANNILDKMEAMAFSSMEFIENFMVILRNSDRYSPAWETEEAQDSLVNLLELQEKKVEAAQILRQRFFRIRADGLSHHEFAARQVFDRLVDLHGDPKQFEDLAELLEESDLGNAPVLNERRLSGKVLYIGGNETQESYRARLKQELGAEQPDLNVDFYFPGWNAWSSHLAKLKPMINQADVVVLNPLMPTLLGRHLRATCNSNHPWFPCTGRGFASLKSSILAAAAWRDSTNSNSMS